MSKRRQLGEVVIKKAGAGFTGERLVIKLVNLDPDDRYPPYEDHCFVCDDKGCREWANCEVMVDGKPTDQYVYHVSECEMEDCES
jgi:hypothetical protein